MVLSNTFVQNIKLERLCLVKKILKDCSFSTRPRANPKEFQTTHSALATTFHIRYSMTCSRREIRNTFIKNWNLIQGLLLQASQRIKKGNTKKLDSYFINRNVKLNRYFILSAVFQPEKL